MRVKIGDTTYDSELEPIMIIMNAEVKQHISNMSSESMTYCSCPEAMTDAEIKKFMGIK